MKGLTWFSKIIYIINVLAAFLLLLSYILVYVEPKQFSVLSVLSLAVPVLIIVNLLFLIYWILRLKKQVMVSAVVLLLGYNFIGSLYQFNGETPNSHDTTVISIMTYNVRIFNNYKWIPSDNVKEDIGKFLNNEQADIIALQEYPRGNPLILEGYNNFNARYTKKAKGGLVVYAKYPIVNSGSLEFLNTPNNAIYVDLEIQQDTIRVYNVHLQSARLDTSVEALEKEGSNLFKRLGSTFKTQQDQAETILKHVSSCPHPYIITGDFNNTAFSYVYRQLLGENLKDSFVESGEGFGRTFNLKQLPLRIDFVLLHKSMQVKSHKSYNTQLSDHFPVKASFTLNE